ncbi:MAG: hypothetical protein R2849_18775 [Thermomicrobiales bacterium]
MELHRLRAAAHADNFRPGGNEAFVACAVVAHQPAVAEAGADRAAVDDVLIIRVDRDVTGFAAAGLDPFLGRSRRWPSDGQRQSGAVLRP